MKIEKISIRKVSQMKIILTFLYVFFLLSTFLSAHFQDYKWEKRTLLEKPSPRHGHAMAYDSIREEIILFGGMGQANSDLKNDTWKWDGSNWLQLFPMDSPSPRVHHHMVYDSGRDKIVLFGGCGEGNVDVNDLWEWNGNTWLKREDIPDPKPEARRAFGMTYDNINGRIYIFGGFRENGYTWFSDFWYFDGNSWTLIDQPGQLKPCARAMVKMEFDDSRNLIFLHGGHFKYGNIFNDSWIWNGINWIELQPNDSARSPSQYSAFALEYMKNEGIIIKFGGATTPGVMQNETWVWDWINWNDLGSDNLPVPRECTSMAYDIKQKNIVMFGGFGGDYGNYRTLDDTWVFSLTNHAPVAICKDIELAADENCQACIAPRDIDGGSYDPDDDAFELSIDNLGPFSLGEHYVNLTVTDEHEASDTCQAKVTVVDITPPTIDSVSASPNLLWPPNHKMVKVTISVSSYDNCYSESTSRIIAVNSNEPENGLGDGDTAPDWEIKGDLTVNLRAERSGTGTGRIYTIIVECIDEYGNSSTVQTIVTVPHNKKKK